MTVQLTPHFTLEELTFSGVARMRHIDNTPSLEEVANLSKLASVLEDVRTLLGHPIYINSGYRCVLLNEAVGGVADSAHIHGLAADIGCPDFGTPRQVCEFLKGKITELGIDQLILEFDSWTHIGISGNTKPRNMLLTINENGTQEGIA